MQQKKQKKIGKNKVVVFLTQFFRVLQKKMWEKSFFGFCKTKQKEKQKTPTDYRSNKTLKKKANKKTKKMTKSFFDDERRVFITFYLLASP